MPCIYNTFLYTRSVHMGHIYFWTLNVFKKSWKVILYFLQFDFWKIVIALWWPFSFNKNKILILVFMVIYTNFDKPTCYKSLIYRLLILQISQILKSLRLVYNLFKQTFILQWYAKQLTFSVYRIFHIIKHPQEQTGAGLSHTLHNQTVLILI
jgi:hypothetical protein